MINLCGPMARDVLQPVSEDDVSNEALRYATARDITIGAAPVLAMRVGYVGELGWELHVPTSYAAHVYELLRDAGRPFGIANVGYRAIDTLRMEKGYLVLVDRHHARHHAVGGRPQLAGQPATRATSAVAMRWWPSATPACTRKLCTFTLEQMAYPVSGEAIIADGEVVGFTTSANFGHTDRQADRLRLPADRARRSHRLRDRGLRRADPGHPTRRRSLRPEERCGSSG